MPAAMFAAAVKASAICGLYPSVIATQWWAEGVSTTGWPAKWNNPGNIRPNPYGPTGIGEAGVSHRVNTGDNGYFNYYRDLDAGIAAYCDYYLRSNYYKHIPRLTTPQAQIEGIGLSPWDGGFVRGTNHGDGYDNGAGPGSKLLAIWRALEPDQRDAGRPGQESLPPPTPPASTGGILGLFGPPPPIGADPGEPAPADTHAPTHTPAGILMAMLAGLVVVGVAVIIGGAK